MAREIVAADPTELALLADLPFQDLRGGITALAERPYAIALTLVGVGL